jgi:trans-aconitate 2-methyltransferase
VVPRDGTRPWLEALADEEARGRFLSEYRAGLAAAFAPRRDGRVLFPFRRLCIVARR